MTGLLDELPPGLLQALQQGLLAVPPFNAASAAAGMPDVARRAFEQSERLRAGQNFDAGPVMQAATTAMTGAMPGAQQGALGAMGGKPPRISAEELAALAQQRNANNPMANTPAFDEFTRARLAKAQARGDQTVKQESYRLGPNPSPEEFQAWALRPISGAPEGQGILGPMGGKPPAAPATESALSLAEKRAANHYVMEQTRFKNKIEGSGLDFTPDYPFPDVEFRGLSKAQSDAMLKASLGMDFTPFNSIFGKSLEMLARNESALKLVPLPMGALDGTLSVWLPFVAQIATRIRCHVADLVATIYSGDVHLLIAWDAEANQALALAGTRVMQRGDDRIGELIWCTGSGRKHWTPLLTEIERYHREHLGCAGMRAIARPGWKPTLIQHGYTMTHIVMDKDFP